MTQDTHFQLFIDALERSGRTYQVRNGECCTRCPFCGDSTKSSQSKHFYINLEPNHRCFCHRCGYRSGYLTTEILEAFEIAERDLSVYARTIMKEQRLSGRSRRHAPALSVGRADRLSIPLPDRSNPDDAATVEYLERRLGGEPLSDAEIQRYKIISTGLYGFLEANRFDALTVPQREGDRLNETCIGFLSADESYIIFRTMDDEYVRRGGRRYTNYRIYPEWEGSKSFACRADVDLLAPYHHVACSEGIIDLIQIERQYYREARWKPDHIGVATCGTAHETILRQLLTLGVLSQHVDLYIDDQDDGTLDSKMLGKVRYLHRASPFFDTIDFRLTVYRNGVDGFKDFGVLPENQRRVRVKL